ncbi:hypothetical protein ACJQWK_11791 [Exserohilum turcicum]
MNCVPAPPSAPADGSTQLTKGAAAVTWGCQGDDDDDDDDDDDAADALASGALPLRTAVHSPNTYTHRRKPYSVALH